MPSTLIIVSGFVYIDNNDNGSYEVGTDDPAPGVTLLIHDDSFATYTATTNNAGEWSVTTVPGTVVVEIVVPNGFELSTPPAVRSVAQGDNAPAMGLSVTLATNRLEVRDRTIAIVAGAVLSGFIFLGIIIAIIFRPDHHPSHLTRLKYT